MDRSQWSDAQIRNYIVDEKATMEPEAEICRKHDQERAVHTSLTLPNPDIIINLDAAEVIESLYRPGEFYYMYVVYVFWRIESLRNIKY